MEMQAERWEVDMVEMRASIFELAEAKKRIGLSNGENGDRLERGRGENRRMIVTTTMFKGTLPAGVPIHGSIELGVPKQSLSDIVALWEQNPVPAPGVGLFTVNHVVVRGEIAINFAKETATLSYRVFKTAQTVAA